MSFFGLMRKKEVATRLVINNLGCVCEFKLQAESVATPRRYRPGAIALREIRRYQKPAELSICRLSFGLLVREVARELRLNVRFQSSAIGALHDAAECALVALFADANICAMHGGRGYVTLKDVQLALRIRGDSVLKQH